MELPDKKNPIAEPEIEFDAAGPMKVILDSESFSIPVIFRSILIVLLFMLAAGIVIVLVSSLGYLFFFLMLAVLLAYFIAPLVGFIRKPFENRGLERFMPRSLAIALSYLIVFTVVGVGIANIAPRVADQGKEFGASLPVYAATIRQTLNDMNRRFDRLRVPEELQTKVNEQISFASQRITEGFGNFVINSVSYLPWLIIVPVLSFFFLKDANLIRLTILRMFPAGRWRIRAEAVVQDVNLTLAAYTRAQLLSCLLIGIVCTIGFSVIGLRYALLLGLLAGIFEFVPLLGPLAIGIIATSTAAFGQYPTRAIYVAIFLGILRIFHDYVSYPRFVRGGIHLHPLLIIIAILAGEQVAGIPGVFLAIPVVAVLTVIYKHVLEHHGKTKLLDGLKDEKSIVAEEAG